MDRRKLVDQVNEEIAKLQRARSLLDGNSPKRQAVPGKSPTQRTYIMNAVARKRIADAQRARWEKIRQAKLEEERAATEKFKAASSRSKKK
jgi:hypothetical protein